MFKKAAQIVVTFSLLVGGYLGYSRGFALLASRIATDHGDDEANAFPELQQASALRATELATESFGADHWTASKELPLQWYDALRGHYIYAQTYERQNEGKRLRLSKFAVIWVSKDGKSRKTATSDEAIVDMNQPFGLNNKPNAEPTHVIHARMTGNVILRDDKGTRNPIDDLLVGPLTYVDYEESTLQITSDSAIRLEDRDMLVTGFGLMIQLRRKAPPLPGSPPSGGSGFDAETMFLYKNPHIIANNVGSSGILPGQSKPDAQGKTPFDLTADGEMRVDLPRPRPEVEVGPPDLNRPPDPTYAHFQRNVQVIRGTTTKDQLNSDTLDVTLMPDRKVVAKPVGADPKLAPGAEPEASGGPLTELKLSRAVARGHAVWIQSESQGLKAKCLELTYDKHTEPGVPDKTYLNGGPAKQLWVEKVDYATQGEAAGTLQSVRTVKALDTTIFDYHDETSLVISRGPGQMEERAARNAPVARTVWWDRDMELKTWREKLGPLADGKPVSVRVVAENRGPLRRVITLKGPSKLVDHKDGNTLDAREKIVAEFEAAPRPASEKGDGATKIKWLQAFGDVHLTANNRVLTARRQFDATFVDAEVVAVAAGPAPVGGSQAAPVVVAANGGEPGFVDAQPEPGAAPVEPAVDGRANFVHATIMQGATAANGSAGKSEVRDAKLRGEVMVHQDPRPGEAHGMEATGEALDLTGQGNGLMRFIVAAEEPSAANPANKLAAGKGGAKVGLVADARPLPSAILARVDFDGKTIEAPVIGLDQKLNFAWAQGPGNLVQLAERGLFDDKGLAAPKSASGKGDTKDSLVITWNEEMKFFGVSRDLQGTPAAKAEFRGTSKLVRTPDGRTIYRRGVEAKMTDAAIYCDWMDVYMDRIVSFDRKGPKPAPAPGASAEPEAQIAQIESRGVDRYVDGKFKDAGVDITSRNRYPGTDIVYEKQRIQHVHVIYDKRTGDFEGRGPGVVYLYQAEQPKSGKLNIVPTTLPVSSLGRTASIRSRPELSPLVSNLPPLKLTKVKFAEYMRGRFGQSKDQAETETRHAEFGGSVQAANAVVKEPNSGIDFDHPPVDYMFLTSDTLHVYSEPPPPGSKEKAPPRQLLNARGSAQARTFDKTIQGDRITFDSATDLTYVYGDADRSVVMIDQKSTGQVATSSYGRSAYYNRRTREGQVVEPRDIQIYDLASGVRPKSFFPDLGGTPKPGDPIKAKRAPLQRPGRNSTDRNGFTGH